MLGPCLAGELALPDITRSDHAVPRLSASPIPGESGLRFAINKPLRGMAHARERGCFPQKGVRIVGKVKEHFAGKALFWCFSPLCDAGCWTMASWAVMCSRARTHKALFKTSRSDPLCRAVFAPALCWALRSLWTRCALFCKHDNNSWFLSFSFSYVWACSPANVKSFCLPTVAPSFRGWA